MKKKKKIIERMKDDIAKLKEQAEINHEDIAELSRQTMRQHDALKKLLLDKSIMSQEEYIIYRRKAHKELCKDICKDKGRGRGIRVVCENCFKMHQVFDEGPIEYDFTSKDKSKVKEWIKKHKKTCDGKIMVQDKIGEKYEEWRD